jgi:hypothetical protein
MESISRTNGLDFGENLKSPMEPLQGEERRRREERKRGGRKRKGGVPYSADESWQPTWHVKVA